MSVASSGDDLFTVQIRWRSSSDCHWELETTHRGFASAEEAVLFATGLASNAVRCLWVERGVLILELEGGRLVEHDGTTDVWKLSDEPAELPEEARFERVNTCSQDLSDTGLRGMFVARCFLVTDPFGRPLSISVQVDLQRDVVRVTVASSATPEEMTPFIIPRA